MQWRKANMLIELSPYSKSNMATSIIEVNTEVTELQNSKFNWT